MSQHKEALRSIVRDKLDYSIEKLNLALAGNGVKTLEPIIKRLGRGGELPHWYPELANSGALPNLDGKTVGSILEMLFVAILETEVLNGVNSTTLKINPARGVDLPDLDLGIKSPSENFCTSEPFFSAYERLYGNEFDCVVMLTDYQTAKKKNPLKLQVINCKYLAGSEIADENLCSIARAQKDWLLEQMQGENSFKRVCRFLAFVNQSDWRAKWLLFFVANLQESDEWFSSQLELATKDFNRQNTVRQKKDRELLPQDDLSALLAIKTITPNFYGVLEQLENWIVENTKDAGRFPNDNEWGRLLTSPLNGKIGMSFALQWRFNFGRLFGEDAEV